MHFLSAIFQCGLLHRLLSYNYFPQIYLITLIHLVALVVRTYKVIQLFVNFLEEVQWQLCSVFNQISTTLLDPKLITLIQCILHKCTRIAFRVLTFFVDAFPSPKQNPI